MARSVASYKIHGLRELSRALDRIERNAARDARDALERVAEPIAASARERKARYPGAVQGSIWPRTSRKSVYVEDKAKPFTGERGDFGSLIVRRVLLPSLYEHEDEVVRELDDTLDRLGRKAGF